MGTFGWVMHSYAVFVAWLVVAVSLSDPAEGMGYGEADVDAFFDFGLGDGQGEVVRLAESEDPATKAVTDADKVAQEKAEQAKKKEEDSKNELQKKQRENEAAARNATEADAKLKQLDTRGGNL